MTPIEIVIPERSEYDKGRDGCPMECPFLNTEEDSETCNLDCGVSSTVAPQYREAPGPRCVPGRYVLVPAAQLEAARKLARIFDYGPDCETRKLARKALGEEREHD